MASDCNLSPNSKPEKKFFKSWFFWKPVLGIVIGGAAGFLYYYFIGSKLGTYSIASNPKNSIIIGSLVGFWIAGSTCKRYKQQE